MDESVLPFRLAATVRQKSRLNIIGPRPDLAICDAMGVSVCRHSLHASGIDLKRIHLRQSDGLGKAAFGSQLARLPLGIGRKFLGGPSGFAADGFLL